MPLSEKRKKHLARQEKKKQLSRTYEERMEKMDEIYTNFAQTGYTITPQIKNFFSICKKWVNQGGIYEGVITDPDLKINICYTLHNSKRRDVGVMIRRIQDTQEQSTQVHTTKQKKKQKQKIKSNSVNNNLDQENYSDENNNTN
jgi:hypothetical protein